MVRFIADKQGFEKRSHVDSSIQMYAYFVGRAKIPSVRTLVSLVGLDFEAKIEYKINMSIRHTPGI